MIKKCILSMLIAAAMIVAGALQAEDSVLLQLKMQPGLKWTEDFNMDFKITTDAQDIGVDRAAMQKMLDEMPEPTTDEERAQIDVIKKFLSEDYSKQPYLALEMEGKRANNVAELKDDGFVMATTLQTIRMSFGGFMMPTTEINSATDKRSGASLDGLLLMVGAELKLLVTKDGKITAVEGIDALNSKAEQEYSKDPILQQQIKEVLAEQKEQLSIQNMAPYPDYAVKAGDQWVIELPMQLGQGETGVQELPVTMTLVKRADGKSYIHGEGRTVVDTPVESTAQPGVVVMNKVPVELNIEIRVDEATGLAEEMTMIMTSHLETASDDGNAQSFDSQMTLKVSNTLDR